ncbi:putative LRR receptor-like serine/threonine-protein kinase At1g51820 isoform X2 [Wolffia australiana]
MIGGIAMALWATVTCILALISISHGQSTEGFISIDCGYGENTSYPASTTGLMYHPDADYVRGGENSAGSPERNLTGYFTYYRTVRSFPSGRRNCYTLRPLTSGRKYLVRAEFWYLNFDGRNSPPSFDVYLGVHFWQTVGADEFTRLEIIFVSSGESVQVCLVNKGLGTPYITVLELRPIRGDMYPLANVSTALILRDDRVNFGATGALRFPSDPYDRVWFGSNIKNTVPVSTNRIISDSFTDFRVPEAVLRTAATTSTLSGTLNFTMTRNLGEKVYAFMHFAELKELKKNETREFNIYADNYVWFAQFRPTYLQAVSVITKTPGEGGNINFSLIATKNSTLPPMINAFEALILVQLTAIPTSQNDTNAVTGIRDAYGMMDWEGDPCEPRNLSWTGLTCSDDGSQRRRILALNLSNFGLRGGISKNASELSALVRLDLSYNNLTGEIPQELAMLPKLQELNLMNNQLNGSIPEVLYNKSRSGTLLLRIEGNPRLRNGTATDQSSNNEKKILPLILGILLPIVFIVAISAVVWVFIKRRRKVVKPSTKDLEVNVGNNREVDIQNKDINSESYQFTFSDIVNMTRNFERPIGRGGFAIVYHGYLSNRTEVAVKMISTSTQGAKGFRAEAQILTRVHHKNLVSLLGYCNDGNNLVLVYEYMPNGSLSDHLSGKAHDNSHLNWSKRLKIALDVAQGLDYLHRFCSPAIIHRDVKSKNILLTEDLEAKLGDFGLSRLFGNNDTTHMTTAIVGTPGYLDPEYHQTGAANEKVDVYSYGIVLLEIITGRPPITTGTDNLSVVSCVRSKVEIGDISSIADQRLNGDYDVNSMWKAVEIAMACASPTSSSRPSMSEVAAELKECLKIVDSRPASTSFSIQKSSDSANIVEYGLQFNPAAR